ncbi:SRPBCC family protein [Streptomyces sp. NPDC002004]
MPQQEVSESTVIEVPPAVVYGAVSNVADMGRWSPECTGADVGDGGHAEVRPGMRFTGHNVSARQRPWSTRCTVVAADPGERFAFEVRAVGLRVARWAYDFAPAGSGGATRVTETWIDQRGLLMRFLGSVVTGVHDRATHNRQAMKVTLQRLKEALEEEHQAA